MDDRRAWGACCLVMASLFVGPDLEETSMKTRSKMIRISRLGTLVVATFALTGAAGRALAAPSTPQPGSLDDAQIAGRVLAFNQAEVQTADAVRGKLSTPPVWQLAQRLTVDDSAIDQKLSALAGKNQQAGSDASAHGQAGGPELSDPFD